MKHDCIRAYLQALEIIIKYHGMSLCLEMVIYIVCMKTIMYSLKH